ncbi:hypothetical protein MN116_007324 [Schistosoma mekongi]|uniref:Uncharacterized protein n=1 Tax=Schistosoma mekongi TaxID=38744 RepID=A0AAE2D4D9_SCHME|nr:hypothetical protein MN116_007324 [Schistosoma mekongi]
MKDSNPLDVVYQLSKEIYSTAVTLLRTDLGKIDGYDGDDALVDIPSLFSNDQITALLDRLRFLRRWAATIPDLLTTNNNNNNNNNNNLSSEIINRCRKDVFNELNNLLDSLFLCLFQEDKIASFWCYIPIDVQSSVILCISVCIQVIINLLSEPSLKNAIELFDINALFSILLSGCRPVICLTDYGLKLWNNGLEHLDQHRINHCRLSSHYAYLMYILLLRVEQNVNNMKISNCILQTLHNKYLRDRVVLQSIMEQACQSMDEENDLSAKPIHFQLLLIQFAISLNKYAVSSPEKIMTNFDVDLLQSVIDITGLALLLLCQNEISDNKQLSTTFSSQSVVAQRILPSSMKSCLSYWFSYLSMFHSSPLINDAMDELLKELSRLCSSWIQELMVYSPDDETVQYSTVYLLSVNYPFARLRGLIHILASITLSGLDCSSNSIQPSIIRNESLNFSNGDQQPVEMQLSVSQESESSSELKVPITQEYANELLVLLCNILVVMHHAAVKLEEFYNIPNSVESDLVKNKGIGVYPSKLAKKMVLLSKRSPFSLVQAICFKQDVIRCIVGLITQFPQLSLSLALHKFDPNDKYTTTNDDTLINSTINTLSLLSAFEVILDATNRDPFNPFCVEWSLLLIRLLFKSNHDQTSQVISILSSNGKYNPYDHNIMHYRQCYTFSTKILLSIISKVSSLHPHQNVFLHPVVNYRLCSSINNPTQSNHSLSTTSQKKLLSTTWMTSKYLSNDWLQQEFSNPFVLNNLKNLLVLCQSECKFGRWRTLKSFSNVSSTKYEDNDDDDKRIDSESLLDTLFLNVYKKELNIDAKTGIRMIHNVCKYEFSEQNAVLQYSSNFDPLRIRLDMLNCDLILSKLCDPLINIGVKDVNKLIERCPDLPLSTMMCIQISDANTTNIDNSSLHQKTILQESLEVLNHYLIHNDVINVVQRFPSVLLRGRSKLIDICEFCIYEMRLESNDRVHAFSSPSHKHSLRHSTGLSISKCPVWELPLEHVRSRYTLLRLAGCWPLIKNTIRKSINVDQQLADLLRSTPRQFTHWLNINLSNSSSKLKKNDKFVEKCPMPNSIMFTKSDIQFYNKVYSLLLTTNDTTDDNDIVDDGCNDNLETVSNCNMLEE